MKITQLKLRKYVPKNKRRKYVHMYGMNETLEFRINEQVFYLKMMIPPNLFGTGKFATLINVCFITSVKGKIRRSVLRWLICYFVEIRGCWIFCNLKREEAVWLLPFSNCNSFI